MKMLKLGAALVLLAALVIILQLADSPKDSPTAEFQRLPNADLRGVAQTEGAAGRQDAALLLLDYVAENDPAGKPEALALRRSVFSKLLADNSPVARLRATGWTALAGGAGSFENLAGTTVADSVLYGEIAELAQRDAFENKQDELVATLNGLSAIGDVFPPAASAIALVKAAKLTGAINQSLGAQLRHIVSLIQPDPKSALSVDKFRENIMPIFELSRKCRTWGEFQTILQQADSPDQVKVLTKMVSAADTAPRRLSEVLALAATEGRPATLTCLDYIMRQGPKSVDVFYTAAGKGVAGLKFVTDHPALTPQTLVANAEAQSSGLGRLQSAYQSLRRHYGPIVAAGKYLTVAVLFGLVILVIVPGAYFEKLIASVPTNARVASETSAVHHLLMALAFGAVLSGTAYVLSMAMRAASVDAAAAAGVELGAATGVAKTDNGLLSGTVVLMSLAIHAVIWFFVRSKIREVEDDEATTVALRLKRLENLDIFLDLPLFCGLTLTIIAFILITLDAGMSRHFAYASTAVGIISAVSLRIRYLYPLKERLIRAQ
jgi:hypothetical protein